VSCLLYEICDFGDLIQLVCLHGRGRSHLHCIGTGEDARPPAGRRNKGSEKIPPVMRESDRECRFE